MPVGSFPYLKRNAGIEKRYGRIDYPLFPAAKSTGTGKSKNCTYSNMANDRELLKTASTFDNNHATISRQMSPDSGRGTTTGRSSTFAAQNPNSNNNNEDIVDRIRRSQAMIIFSPPDNLSCNTPDVLIFQFYIEFLWKHYFKER